MIAMGPFRHLPALGFALLLSTALTVPAIAQQKVGVTSAVNPAAYQGGRTLSIGSDILFKEQVKTDAGGQAQILFLDRSALTVGPNAELTIDQFVYDPAAREGKLAVAATQGVIRFIGGQLSKSGDVTVRTPTATIGIRGMIATFNIQPNGPTQIHVNFGAQATVRTNNNQVVIVQPGNTATIPTGGGPVVVAPTTPTQLASINRSMEGSTSSGNSTPSTPQPSGGTPAGATNQPASNSSSQTSTSPAPSPNQTTLPASAPTPIQNLAPQAPVVVVPTITTLNTLNNTQRAVNTTVNTTTQTTLITSPTFTPPAVIPPTVTPPTVTPPVTAPPVVTTPTPPPVVVAPPIGGGGGGGGGSSGLPAPVGIIVPARPVVPTAPTIPPTL